MKSRLKHLFLPWALSVLTRLMRVMRAIGTISVDPFSVMVLPPWSPGSIGDEAVMRTAIAQLRKLGFKAVTLIAYEPNENWGHVGDVNSLFNLQAFFKNQTWRSQVAFVRRVSRCAQFYVFGTDMMDGFYGEQLSVDRATLAGLAARAGVRTQIVSISFNNTPTSGSVHALRALPASVRITARDPISHERLVRIVQRPIELTADVAFLLEPATDSQTVTTTLDWVRAQKAQGRTVVGVNVNHLLLRQVPGLTPEQLACTHALAIQELFAQNAQLSFLMVPHDVRDEVSDVSLARDVLAELPAELRPYAMQVPSPFHAPDIKAIVAELDMVLSGKMHLAIACFGRSTPVACVVYQDKFEGLFRHFELSDLTLDPSLVMQPGQLSGFLGPHIQHRDALQEHIKGKLPHVLQLAQLNFVPPAL